MAPSEYFIPSVLLALSKYVAVIGQTISTTTETEASSSISEGETYAALGILGFLVLLFAIICADVIHKRFQQNQKSLMPAEFDLDKTLIGRNPNVSKDQNAAIHKNKNTNKNNVNTFNTNKNVVSIEVKEDVKEEEQAEAEAKEEEEKEEEKEVKKEKEEKISIPKPKPKTPPVVTMNDAWDQQKKENEKEKKEKEIINNKMTMDEAWNEESESEEGDLLVELHSVQNEIDKRLTQITNDEIDKRLSTRL